MKLFEQVKENILIQRGGLELHELLKEEGKLQRLVDLTYKSVVHNLNSIYRMRNDLVHNGGSMSSDKESQIRYLQKYLNHFLGTLIYHMKRNEDTNIPEILYSIDSTYMRFMEDVKRINHEMKKYGEKVAEMKAEMGKANNQNEKNGWKRKLEELDLEYEGYIRNNIEAVAFPKYLYLV